MAVKAAVKDPLTMAVPKETKVDDEPRVEVFLPKLEEEEGSGIKVDQYEHVTLANELGENVYYVKRGEHVDVPVSVFIALKAKYSYL